jgi:hypothetical protein
MRLKLLWFAFLSPLLACTGTAYATDISGTIATTLTIMDNSRLVGDVTCTVIGGPCIVFGASGLTLDLNGHSMTGLGDPLASCAGVPFPPGPTGGEAGILANGMANVVIRGLGLVQRFRMFGINLNNSTGATVTNVTLSTNCFSGIILNGGSGHLLQGNTSVRNGNPNAPCGGI